MESDASCSNITKSTQGKTVGYFHIWTNTVKYTYAIKVIKTNKITANVRLLQWLSASFGLCFIAPPQLLQQQRQQQKHIPMRGNKNINKNPITINEP